MVPVADYLELVATQLVSKNEVEIDPDGSMRPIGLSSSPIEQVDQQAAWPTCSDPYPR